MPSTMRPPASWNAGREIPKAFSTAVPPNAAPIRMIKTVIVTLIAAFTLNARGRSPVIEMKIPVLPMGFIIAKSARNALMNAAYSIRA